MCKGPPAGCQASYEGGGLIRRHSREQASKDAKGGE